MMSIAKCYLDVRPEEGLSLVESLNPLGEILAKAGMRNLNILNSAYLMKDSFDNYNLSPVDKVAIGVEYTFRSKEGFLERKKAVIVVETDGKVRLQSDEKI